MLSNERITAIQALRVAITPPPWTFVPVQIDGDRREIKPAILYSADDGLEIYTTSLLDEDGAFIAAAPQIVDDLLAERAALLTRLAELEQKRLYTDWG